MENLRGKKVRIVGSHPHTGMTGIIKAIERTPAGLGLRIILEDGMECFVFNMKNLRIYN